MSILLHFIYVGHSAGTCNFPLLSFVRQGQTLLSGEWLNSSFPWEEVYQVQPLSAAKVKSLLKKKKVQISLIRENLSFSSLSPKYRNMPHFDWGVIKIFPWELYWILLSVLETYVPQILPSPMWYTCLDWFCCRIFIANDTEELLLKKTQP